MKEIEVGDYVRTKEGEIHKVIKIIEDDGDWDYYCCGNISSCLNGKRKFCRGYEWKHKDNIYDNPDLLGGK